MNGSPRQGAGNSALVLTQQAREEDVLRVRQSYSRSIGQAEVQPFFKDLPKRIADSHLVIARSGASTVAEAELATSGLKKCRCAPVSIHGWRFIARGCRH